MPQFHDRAVVASLKRWRFWKLLRGRQEFHDRAVVASLKPVPPHRRNRQPAAIPRPRVGALIEAQQGGRVPCEPPPIPRPRGRGLIEAISILWQPGAG